MLNELKVQTSMCLNRIDILHGCIKKDISKVICAPPPLKKNNKNKK